MRPGEDEGAAPAGSGRSPVSRRWRFASRVALVLLGAAAWYFVYVNLEAFSKWFTYELLGMTAGSRLASAVPFFVFEAPKVLMLLTVVVFGVGIVRSFFTPERTRRILAGKRETLGNVLAALLGVVTPFCSCSAVPLFIGFVTHRRAARRHVLVPHRRADDQRGRARAALRPLRLEGGGALHGHGPGHRHRRRAG